MNILFYRFLEDKFSALVCLYICIFFHIYFKYISSYTSGTQTGTILAWVSYFAKINDVMQKISTLTDKVCMFFLQTLKLFLRITYMCCINRVFGVHRLYNQIPQMICSIWVLIVGPVMCFAWRGLVPCVCDHSQTKLYQHPLLASLTQEGCCKMIGWGAPFVIQGSLEAGHNDPEKTCVLIVIWCYYR